MPFGLWGNASDRAPSQLCAFDVAKIRGFALAPIRQVVARRQPKGGAGHCSGNPLDQDFLLSVLRCSFWINFRWRLKARKPPFKAPSSDFATSFVGLSRDFSIASRVR